MDDKRRDAERDKSSPEERRDPASTAEILADIDRSVEEYSFSIDDILAEFGVERTAEPEPEPAPEPEPQVPAYEMTSEELTDKLGEVAARMQEEREEQKLRETEEQLRSEKEERERAEAEREREKRERELELEIKRQVELAADHVTEEQNEYPAEPGQRDEMGRIHIFEEEKTQDTEKRRRFGGKKREDEEPAERRTVMKEAKAEEGKKVFGGKLEGIFGHDAEFRPQLRGGDVSEETFKQEHEEKLRKHRRRRPEPEEPAAEPSETEPDIEPEEEVSLLVRELGRGRLRLLLAALLTALLAFISFAPYIGIGLPAIFTYVEKPYIYIFFNVLLQVGGGRARHSDLPPEYGERRRIREPHVACLPVLRRDKAGVGRILRILDGRRGVDARGGVLLEKADSREAKELPRGGGNEPPVHNSGGAGAL